MSSGSVVPLVDRLLLITQAYGSIFARRKSSCNAAAWETGVTSGSVTMMTHVNDASCNRISGVVMCVLLAVPSYCCTIWRW